MASPPTLWMEMESGGAENRMRWRKIGKNISRAAKMGEKGDGNTKFRDPQHATHNITTSYHKSLPWSLFRSVLNLSSNGFLH